MRRPGSRDADAGSATVLVLGIALVVICASCALVMLGAALCARHSAQAAADLSALAAAQRIGVDASGCAAAGAVAAANGAALDRCEIAVNADGRSGAVEVTVSRSVGTGSLARWVATAQARAQRLE